MKIHILREGKQFASDLDKATQNQSVRGQRLCELREQSQSAPLVVEHIMTIFTETNGYLDSFEIGQVRKFLSRVMYLSANKNIAVSRNNIFYHDIH